MNPYTPEEVADVRAWTAEIIPAGGTEADTNFTDAAIGALIDKYESLERAAADIWRRKAAALLSGTLVEEKSVGSERFKFMATKDRHAAYLEQADLYDSLSIDTSITGGTQTAELEPDDVLGLNRDPRQTDISRLIGDPYGQ